MTDDLEKMQAHIKRRILEGISEHIGVLTNSPLLMLVILPVLTGFILLFYGLYSGVLTDYQSTFDWCNNNWLHCANIGSWWLPLWFVARASMVLSLFAWYWLMRWSFEKGRWKAWWIFYAAYGYVSVFAISTLFSSWLYTLPIAWRGWISVGETMLLLGLLTREYWVRTPIDFIERLMKAMLPLASVAGILGIIGVVLGRSLSKNGSIALLLLILGLVTFPLIVIPTAYTWGRKIWASNPWLIEKDWRKKGELQ